MTLRGPEFKKALLLGLVLGVVPVFYYPRTFGWAGAAAGGTMVFVVELLYYLLVYQFVFGRESFLDRLKASGVALAYRVCLGVMWGILAGSIHGLSASQALSLGIVGYLPGVLFQAAIVPHLLRPVFRFRDLRRPRTIETPMAVEPPSPKRTSMPADSAVRVGGADIPDFDAAMAHVASYSTVEYAMLVDDEGLTVARATRGTVDTDLWAPVINLLYGSAWRELSRTSDSNITRFQLTLTHQRLVVERVAPFYLAVLFDHNTDELVNVRIAQAVEMVKKYYEHKYPKVAPATATEVAYV